VVCGRVPSVGAATVLRFDCTRETLEKKAVAAWILVEKASRQGVSMGRVAAVLAVLMVVGCGPRDPIVALQEMGAEIARNSQGQVNYIDLSGDLVFDDRTGNLLRIETQVTAAGLSHLQDMTALQELRLSHTEIGDRGLIHLQSLSNLERLDLTGTSITDQGLVHLRGLKKLRKLWLDRSACSPAALEELTLALPDLAIFTE
jgi:hypothetical protein